MEIEFKNKHIIIKIGDTDFEISLYLSMHDVCLVSEYIDSGEKEYNVAVARIIEAHIIPNQTENSLINTIANDYNVLHTYIEKIICEEENLKTIYDKYENESDICYRFLCAVNENLKIQSEKASKAIAGVLENVFSKINVQRSQYLDTLTKTANMIQKVLEPYNRISEKIAQTLVIVNQRINDIFSGIKIPHVSDERKEILCKSYEAWGTFGWTILPQAEINLYNQPPQTQKEANEIAMTYCKNKDMVNLFEDTKKLKGVKTKDFEEAVFAYQNKKYKSCAMLLFSLIDAKLIRMQTEEDKGNKRYRDCGKRAVKNIEKRLAQECDINNTLFLMLSYKNLFACLLKFFDDGNDFKEQPALANRNFIDHGMLTKNVRKRDCIQLFLLYYNFLEFFEIINNESNTDK